ncbi:MAG: LemA family protein [Bacillota bacterium]|nr:LemA family protein [Bacillota bacterium]
MDIGYTLLGILILAVAFVVYTYNRLISLHNMADTAYANIDTLLQKRFDLVPNLVSTVKGYMRHEQELLETITRARTEWLKASTISENAGADDTAARALKTLFAVSENYPELKANENFMMLQEELAGIENKIAYARQRYNRTIMVLNTVIQRFPTNLIAQLFKFETREFFTVESEKARSVPHVQMQEGDGK